MNILRKIKNIIKNIPNKINNNWNKLIRKISLIRYIKFSKYFDSVYYKNTYKDVNESNLLPYIHYYEIGWKKGYNPSIKFDQEKYYEHNPDILNSNLCPLFHFEKYGKKEGRKAFFVDPQYNENYKTKKIRRYILRKINNTLHYRLIRKNKDVKILVYIHIFYIKSIDEIIEYLKNLEKYNYDLIISCTKNSNELEIINRFKAFKPNTKIYTLENRGFDIGPFIEVLNKTNLDKYDILFKLQSKGTFTQTNYIYGQIFKNRDWFEYMYESTLGANYIHQNIDLLKNNKKIGIIAANNLVIKDPKHKQNFTINWLKNEKIKLKEDYQFVAGTCYAQKIELAKEIKNLHLSIKDFEPSNKGYFSFAHAMERYLTASNKNYIIHKNKVNKLKQLIWKNTSKKIAQKSGSRIINNEKIKISDDFCLRFLEHALIENYNYEKIALGEIKREFNNTYYPLNQCSPYLFLEGEKKRYINYCLNNRRTDYMNISEKEFQKKIKKECVKSYQNLIERINKTGYQSKNPIIVDQNNCILDGQHRACILLKKYGSNHKITVLKLNVIKTQPKITPFMKLK